MDDFDFYASVEFSDVGNGMLGAFSSDLGHVDAGFSEIGRNGPCPIEREPLVVSRASQNAGVAGDPNPLRFRRGTFLQAHDQTIQARLFKTREVKAVELEVDRKQTHLSDAVRSRCPADCLVLLGSR